MNDKNQFTLATCLWVMIPLSWALVVAGAIWRIESDGWRGVTIRGALWLLLSVSFYKVSQSLVRPDRNWGDVVGAILLLCVHAVMWFLIFAALVVG